MRHLSWRRLIAGSVLVALLGGGFILTQGSDASAGQCPNAQGGYFDENGNWVSCHGAGRPSTTGTGGTETTRGGGGPQTWCPPRHWITLGGYDSVPPHIRPYSWDDAPPGSTFQYDACTCPASSGFCPGATTRWIPPEEAAPDPGEVAAGVWAEVRRRLLRPQVATDPPSGEPSVVSVPTFVEVTNWQGEISDGGCDGTVCVSLTAVPTLTWNTGEPERVSRLTWGAGESETRTITCEDGGTSYDPNGGSARAQASASGACAHAYRFRTSVRGRPSAWPGEVNITWEVSWETVGEGLDDSGTFPDVVLSTDVARPVVDVSSVVVDDR